MSPGVDGPASFDIYSGAGAIEQDGKSWLLHATGKVSVQQDNSSITPDADRENAR